MPEPGWKRARVFSIGHSTHPLEEFVELLRAHGVRTVADVRSLPGSRAFPHFNRERLEPALRAHDLGYAHLPRLGGRRRARSDGTNDGWRHPAFRGYADYMQTAEFAAGLEELRRLARHGPVALLCAEAVPWRCHRSLIADALAARGVVVHHIASRTRAPAHVPPAFAQFDGHRVTYPAPAEHDVHA